MKIYHVKTEEASEILLFHTASVFKERLVHYIQDIPYGLKSYRA